MAGNGAHGYGGDNGSATDAKLSSPQGITVGPDGSLYISEYSNNRIRRVNPGGIITTIAGIGQPAGCPQSIGDGGPAINAVLCAPIAAAVAPDGRLFIADSGNARIRVVSALFPGLSLSDILIASEDGTEVYVFDGKGRHKRTLHALTGEKLYEFAYDSNGYLHTVTDGDGNVTTIEHDANGTPTIKAPFGQTTTLQVDSNGYLTQVKDPGGNTFSMTYRPDGLGLLETFTDPNGNVASPKYSSIMDYDDASGRLKRDTDAAGGFTKLDRIDADHAVTLTTALNRTTTYQIENQPTGTEQRINKFPDGTQSELLIGTDGSRKTTLADKTVLDLVQGPDPRFSMQAPIDKTFSITAKAPVIENSDPDERINLEL